VAGVGLDAKGLS